VWLFAADENFNGTIVRELLRIKLEISIVRVQDAGLSGAADPDVLAWAAHQQRILLTHDVTTLADAAYQRIIAGLPMPGVFEISSTLSIGMALEELILVVECSTLGEWNGRVTYLPLR
jgi:Domain of unknown function (DUF5615)